MKREGKPRVFLFTLHSSLFTALALSGCALWRSHDPQAEAAWQSRRPALEAIDHFTMHARFSAGGPFGAKGNLLWRQRADGFDLRAWGPFATGAIQVSGTADLVEVRTGKETVITPDPAAFLEQRLGWRFPVRELRWWALGLPAPDSAPVMSLDSEGHLLDLEQGEWRVSYDEYQSAGALELPRRLELEGEDVTVKVFVDSWELR